jgi:hypothetical protein
MMHRLPLVVGLLAVTAITATAQLTDDHNLYKDRYRNLFGGRDMAQTNRPPADVSGRGAAEKPIVCGMRILPADPTIDPKIRVAPPARAVLDHKLRKLSPPICKPE